MTWMQTYGRRRFAFDDPSSLVVDIGEIAHALSNICRFGGHTTSFYSVAQHSVLVSLEAEHGDPPATSLQRAMAGLLHDAAEAYVGDVVRPLKYRMDGYREFEARLQEHIFRSIGVPWPYPFAVQHADDLVLATEVRDVMGGPIPGWTRVLPDPRVEKIWPQAPSVAKIEFLDRWNYLWNLRTPLEGES